MIELKQHLEKLDPDKAVVFAKEANSTINSLRKAVSTNANMKIETCVDIVKASNGAVSLRGLKPNLDWDFIKRNL